MRRNTALNLSPSGETDQMSQVMPNIYFANSETNLTWEKLFRNLLPRFSDLISLLLGLRLCGGFASNSYSVSAWSSPSCVVYHVSRDSRFRRERKRVTSEMGEKHCTTLFILVS